MVFKTMSLLAVLLIILAVFLFIVLVGTLIKIAVFVLLVLGIVWLWKEINKGKRRK